MDTTFWRSSGPLMTLWIPGSHICRFSHQQIVNIVHNRYTVGWGWLRCGIGRYRKVRVLVAQSRLTLCNPTNCSPPGSSVHGILQARMLEWVAIPFFRSSWPRNGSGVCCIAGRFLTIWSHQGSPGPIVFGDSGTVSQAVECAGCGSHTDGIPVLSLCDVRLWASYVTSPRFVE